MSEIRTYNKNLGSYMPAFFYMKLSFPYYDSSTMLYNLSKKNLSIFIHEYIHFLQDISSYSLLNNAYVYSEYMHAAANYIYSLPKGKFYIPLKLPYNLGNVDLNKYVNETCMGDFGSRDDIFIKKVEFQKIRVPYQNSKVHILTIPFLKLIDGTKLKFGTCAIMESMAYLIERTITKDSVPPPDYPYLTAENVASIEYPEFSHDILNIIALCDLSLQFVNPGLFFVETLRNMKAEKYLPPSPEHLYERVYNQPCMFLEKTTTLPMALIHMGMMVQDRIKLYLNDSRFIEFHNTIRDFIGFGIECRLRNPHFIIEIVREGYALYNKSLLSIMNRVGTPLIIDSEYNFTHIPAAGKGANTSLQYFLAIEELYKCFSNGNTLCEMYDFCEATKNNAKEIFGADWQNQEPLMDDNCVDSPWLKVNDVRLCPYALLWRHWNLRSWEPKEYKTKK